MPPCIVLILMLHSPPCFLLYLCPNFIREAASSSVHLLLAYLSSYLPPHFQEMRVSKSLIQHFCPALTLPFEALSNRTVPYLLNGIF